MINVFNTNTAPYQVYDYLATHGIVQDSRNGRVLSLPHPILIHYMKPWQCVNFCPVRDANPFFHFMEMMWFLEGRGDTGFITHYLPRMMEYSDDKRIFNAHYGYRIRYHFNRDQLKEVVNLLQQDPLTRQAVVQIWCPSDLTKNTLDKACNLLLMFRVVADKLTMTVANRSNDALWGGVTGANITNLFIFQAYVANRTGYQIGSQYVMSNNLHLYLDNPKVQRMLDKYTGKTTPLPENAYPEDDELLPLINGVDPLAEAKEFCEDLRGWGFFPKRENYSMTSLAHIGVPLAQAHYHYKNGNIMRALEFTQYIAATDWRLACQNWLTRRMKNRK